MNEDEVKVARPREFDESEVLEAVVACFWSRGYEGTTVRHLVDATGVKGASLYNAFGDKRDMFLAALDQFVSRTIDDRIERCRGLPPVDAITTFFSEVLERSLTDREHKGCMLVNSAVESAALDAGIQRTVAGTLLRMERFFHDMVVAGQFEGSIATHLSAHDVSAHLLGVLMGVRVLARVRPERALLSGVIQPALTLLQPRSLGEPANPRLDTSLTGASF